MKPLERIHSLPDTGNARPFLKWAGGKRQLLPALEQLFPQELKNGKIKHYYEPFSGSGAVFFYLASKFKFREVFLYDSNQDLINVYEVLRDKPAALIAALKDLENQYLKSESDKRRELFFAVRERFNLKKIKRKVGRTPADILHAADFIFINRTCYNGLYRVNSKGLFNTPPGRYEKPTICDHDNLMRASGALANAELRLGDFSTVLNDLKSGSFVYFDPPYRPLNKTSVFNGYQSARFDDTEQIRLAGVFHEIDLRGEMVMLSNSDPRNGGKSDLFFDKLYSSFNICRITARRSINSDATKRGPINEIVVRNYR